jgi:predicted phosphoadenosine phosphosulfate sulfurtransferase
MPASDVSALVAKYIATWSRRGYATDLPDEVPSGLMRAGLAPSYKAICVAILKNDASMSSLGFSPRHSDWYDALKRIELAARPDAKRYKIKQDSRQLSLLEWRAAR